MYCYYQYKKAYFIATALILVYKIHRPKTAVIYIELR